MQTVHLDSEGDAIASQDKTVVVVCAADDRYAMPLAVVARSALENLQPDYKIKLFVIDGGITDSNKHRIEQSLNPDRCQINFIPKPDSWLAAVQDVLNYLQSTTSVELQHITASVAPYYRLFMAELLPAEIERVIYLDCDLVVKDNLKKLWEADFNDNYVLAVQDIWVPYVSSMKGVPYEKLQIPADSKYFNSGVLVINLRKWRANNITAQAIAYLKSYQQEIRAHDQDVLNGLFVGQWGELDSRWNVTPAIVDLFPSWQDSPFSKEVYQQLINHPSIVHFATNRKPWNSRHTLFKDTFFEYIDKTSWSGWRLTLWRRLQLAVNRQFKRFLRRF